MISFTECTGNLFSKKKMFVVRFLLSVDVFSFGCILWETWQRKKPWSWLNDTSEIIDAVSKEKKRLPFKGTSIPAPQHYDTLMSQCWHHEREKRPLIDFVRSKLLDFMDDAQSLDCNRTDDDDETKQKTLVESKTINVELSVVN